MYSFFFLLTRLPGTVGGAKPELIYQSHLLLFLSPSFCDDSMSELIKGLFVNFICVCVSKQDRADDLSE